MRRQINFHSSSTWVNTILELTCKNSIFLWRSNWRTIFGRSGDHFRDRSREKSKPGLGPKRSIGHFNKVGTGRLGNWILAELKRERIFRNCSRQFLIPNITPGGGTAQYKMIKNGHFDSDGIRPNAYDLRLSLIQSRSRLAYLIGDDS